MLRDATNDDWRSLVGTDPPGYWHGLVYVEGGAVLGIGGVFEAEDGRWWAVVKAIEKRPVALMRATREVLAAADRAGVPLLAKPSPQIDGADRFLARIGFRPTPELLGGEPVWTR